MKRLFLGGISLILLSGVMMPAAAASDMTSAPLLDDAVTVEVRDEFDEGLSNKLSGRIRDEFYEGLGNKLSGRIHDEFYEGLGNKIIDSHREEFFEGLLKG